MTKIKCPYCGSDNCTLEDHQSLSLNDFEYGIETELYATAKCANGHSFELKGVIHYDKPLSNMLFYVKNLIKPEMSYETNRTGITSLAFKHGNTDCRFWTPNVSESYEHIEGFIITRIK